MKEIQNVKTNMLRGKNASDNVDEESFTCLCDRPKTSSLT